jgi:hypothetical protein
MKCSTLKHGESENKILLLDDARARIGPKMRSPRPLLTGWALKSLPNPQAHHWATPTCHNSRNTQAYLHTFKSTSKYWATKAQQDWPINGITSRSLSPSCSPPPLITFPASTDHMVSNPNVPSPPPHGFLTALGLYAAGSSSTVLLHLHYAEEGVALSCCGAIKFHRR